MPLALTRKQAVDAVLCDRRSIPSTSGAAFAPVNIALCKYWGKRNIELNLPITSSLSISLGKLGTRTLLTPAESDCVFLNGAELPLDSPFGKRLFSFIDLMRRPGDYLRVETTNSVPTAAGLASSASGFAACVSALNDLYQWHLSKREQSILARMGSGSACRSLFDGFVQWHAGTAEDGSDSYGAPLPFKWPHLRIGLCLLQTTAKPKSSTQGMITTVDTSTLYTAWPKQVEEDLPLIMDAVKSRNFGLLGKAAERNALAMHATMIAATPPLIYWTSETVETIHKVHRLRNDGLAVYLTMDAGPNVKLLFEKENQEAVSSQFPGLEICTPFE